MRRSRSRSLRIELVILAVLTDTWSAAPALAHKMVVFATGAEGAIEGEVYFHGGEPARNVKVTLFAPDDRVVGETTTDPEGKFRFPIQFRCDYRVIADAGAGHGAEYTVPADELPDDLPSPGGEHQPGGEPSEQAASTVPDEHDAEATPGESHEGASAVASGEEAARAESHHEPLAVSDAEGRNAEIEAIGRQLAALRRDFDRYRNELRLREVLGGLGYILGIMGTAFYFLGVRRKEKRSAPRDS